MPLAGAAIGAASGAIGGALTDVGINNKWMRDIAAAIQPGRARRMGEAAARLGESSRRDGPTDDRRMTPWASPRASEGPDFRLM
jgi:hypothetical protein